MITSSRMKRLIAVVLESDVDGVTRALLDEGVMHFINVGTIAGDEAAQLQTMRTGARGAAAAGLRRRIEQILKVIDVRPTGPLDIKTMEFTDEARAERSIGEAEKALAELRSEADAANAEVRQIEEIVHQVSLYGDFADGIPRESSYSYLTMHTGSIPADKAAELIKSLEALPAVAVKIKESEDLAHLFVIGMKRDTGSLEALLDAADWQDINLSGELSDAGDTLQTDLMAKIDAARARARDIDTRLRDAVTDRRDGLEALWAELKMNELYLRIQSYFSQTARTVVFSGWVPERLEIKLDSSIRNACSSTCYLEWQHPGEQSPEVPVELKNPRFLKPFELLVRNYSTPSYGSIDPTPLVAVAYLTMFGLMFGDFGHGLVLALTGFVSRIFYKKQNNVRSLFSLLIYCGFASMVTGILFGSYFGFQLFPPLWFDFHGVVSGHGGGPLVSSVYDVLAITIYFGVSVIGLGLMLNWTNLIRGRRWFGLVFDKTGLLGGIIYGGGVWATRYFVRSGYSDLPDGRLLFLLLGIPVLLLALKSPLEHSRQRKKLHLMSLVDFTMDWIVEILEIFSGYLANTLSFMRVAGLGIAHEALLIAFFQIAATAGGGSVTSFGAILVLIAGNVLIIGLEGLSAGIQSLRLNYYEFFSKYFTGAGRPYNPVTLRNTGG